jgi:hypothetical protein
LGGPSDFWGATISVIAADHMTIQYEDTIEHINVTLSSVCRPGPDGEFANGLSGLGGGASSSSRFSRCRKRANKADQKYDWSIDNVTKIFVKPANDVIIPV